MLNDSLKGAVGIISCYIVPTVLRFDPAQLERLVQLVAQVLIAGVTIWSIVRKQK